MSFSFSHWGLCRLARGDYDCLEQDAEIAFLGKTRQNRGFHMLYSLCCPHCFSANTLNIKITHILCGIIIIS